MGFDGINVDHASLDQAADDMALANKQITDRLNTFDQATLPLRQDGGEWAGRAAASYDVAKNQWTEQINAMNAILQEAGFAVQNANAEYMHADKQGEASFQAI